MTLEGQRQLGIDEGDIPYPYDDATGQRIVKGYTLKGNITIGKGIKLMNGLARDELEFMFQNKIKEAEHFLWSMFGQWDTFSPRRQDALINMVFNNGDHGFMGFEHMIKAIFAGDWATAAKECKDSKNGRNLVARYDRISKALEEG